MESHYSTCFLQHMKLLFNTRPAQGFCVLVTGCPFMRQRGVMWPAGCSFASGPQKAAQCVRSSKNARKHRVWRSQKRMLASTHHALLVATCCHLTRGLIWFGRALYDFFQRNRGLCLWDFKPTSGFCCVLLFVASQSACLFILWVWPLVYLPGSFLTFFSPIVPIILLGILFS